MDHPCLAVLNDKHIGAIRTAGTTVNTAFQLRGYLLASLETDLQQIDCDLLINGDLFDKELIPLSDLLGTTTHFVSWLKKGHKLWLSPGNHDLSKTSSNLSSFQFLGRWLEKAYPGQVTYIKDLTEIYPGYWVLPHLPNQDMLDAALAEVPECHALFVHVNFDNGFAAQSDHSLNMSRDQAEACKAQYIIFGHEHQTKTALNGKVMIPGNQIPSSVADCLGATDNAKFRVQMEDGKPVFLKTMDLPFVDMDWQALAPTDALFVRVSGEATPDQGAQVTQAIARYRAGSPALVITNAVRMRTEEGQLAEFAQSLEQVTAFDVRAALRKLLTDDENLIVDKLLEQQ